MPQGLGVSAQAAPAAERAPARLDDHSLYFNRELSWVDFNDRVLQIAEDEKTPLLERLEFCAIFASNLDEFFMVRVAGLHDQVEAGIDRPLQDGRSPNATIDAIRERVCGQVDRLQRCVGELRAALAERGVRVVRPDELDDPARRELEERFDREIFPVLTPLAVGQGRPFPYISNLSLSLAVGLRDPESGQEAFARVKVPKEILPRFVQVGEGADFVALEDVIAAHLDRLFPGMEVRRHAPFRVTRDADLTVSGDAEDLVAAVQAELRRRRFGEVVRLQVAAGMGADLRAHVVEGLEVEERDVYAVDGLLDVEDLPALADAVRDTGGLRAPPWRPVDHPRLRDRGQADVLAAMRAGDVLVHHPYDAFESSVVRLVDQAVADPRVLAIKQTVYRTSDDSPLVPALIRATERGKQAVCLVEVKARFDEANNIQWARRLEQAGVHVVYGHPGLKTHAKAILIVRREEGGIRHYLHVGTGNYHPKTAGLYTDFGLLTCDPELGADVADLFNFLTGYARPEGYRKALVAPNHLREAIVAEIEATAEAHEPDRPARIVMKMNALVDEPCIRALYRASQAGVRVDLNVRGICCLRPGVPGVSENVRVVSVVSRFLEHSRVFAFERAGQCRMYLGSADLMPRNLDSRVELVVPVEDAAARRQLLDALERYLADNVDAWELRADGHWERRRPEAEKDRRRAQEELMARHTERARAD